MSDKVKTSINLDKEAFEFIAKMSKKESRSVSQQINKMILDAKEKEEGK